MKYREKKHAINKNSKVALVTSTLITFGWLTEGAMGASLFTIENPYRHFQHQKEAGGVWTEEFDGCCFATSAATVAMSIADNHTGITLNGFTNTSLGAENFEKQYSIGGTSGKVANGVTSMPVTGIPAWVGNGNWVDAPWFSGKAKGKLRVQDYYFMDASWATIPATIPTLNVVGAFALVEAVAPFPPADVEWWGNYHVVGVYEFDFAARTMKITDSNKDRNGVEYTDGIAAHTVGGAILTGAGILDTLTWTVPGILTNNDGTGIDDEQLVSLRVIHKVPEPSAFLGTLVACGLGLALCKKRNMS